MNRSTIVLPLSTSRCGIIGRPWPRADWATNDRAVTEARGEVVARLLGVDVEQWSEAPQRGERRQGRLDVDAHVAGVDGEGKGSAGGSPGSNSLSTSSPHTWPNETRPTRSLMSTPR